VPGLITSLLLIGNALILGFRHGIDWDHVAAIMDIVGTTAIGTPNEGHTTQAVHKRTLTLAFLYAMGHSAILILLGICASALSGLLPRDFARMSECLVGWTLIAFGLCVMYVLVQHARTRQALVLQSRWMLLLSAGRKAYAWLLERLTGRKINTASPAARPGPRTAFSLGVIHGLGAETGTQLLLIAAVGSTGVALGLSLLAAFVTGFVISNPLMALVATTGFIKAASVKPLYILAGATTAMFSLIVGTIFVTGINPNLASLSHLITG
jgi:hypothetical protein